MRAVLQLKYSFRYTGKNTQKKYKLVVSCICIFSFCVYLHLHQIILSSGNKQWGIDLFFLHSHTHARIIHASQVFMGGYETNKESKKRSVMQKMRYIHTHTFLTLLSRSSPNKDALERRREFLR